MDLKYTIDDLLRYWTSGAIFSTYLLISFPEISYLDWFSWHFFVIFSFIAGILLFAIARIIVDKKEEKEYYEGAVGKIIISEFPEKKPTVHLSRALENYYFWRYKKRADMFKIHRRASYVYFYLSASFAFVFGIAFSLISLGLWFCGEKCINSFAILILIFLVAVVSSRQLHKKYKSTWKDQEYLLKVTFLNELRDGDEKNDEEEETGNSREFSCFEDFLDKIVRINDSRKIIPEF